MRPSKRKCNSPSRAGQNNEVFYGEVSSKIRSKYDVKRPIKNGKTEWHVTIWLDNIL